MTIELHLQYLGKYQWTKSGEFYFIGYAFDQNNTLYTQAENFQNQDIHALVKQLRGAFSIISVEKNITHIYQDTIASFPLFYKKEDQKVIIQTSPTSQGESWSVTAVEDFQNIFCTQYDSTLLPAWKSIPAGHHLSIDVINNTIALERYFHHFSLKKASSNPDKEKQLVEIIDNWAQQILQFAQGNPIWIPLSGGYDSRLILCALLKAQAPKLHAYTYGKSLSPEVVNAHKTAKELKVDWHFIPYDDRAFMNFFSQYWENLSVHNHHFQSLPHEQDFFALLALKQQGLLKDNFIVVPGYCGDIPTGSYLKKRDIQVKDYIQEKHQVQAQHLISDISDWDAYQQWLCENRLSKFIVNSVRSYEYFGGKWMLPMWHQDFLNLFYDLKNEEKWNQKFYVETIFKHYFEPFNVDFYKNSGDAPQAETTIKDRIKSILPSPILKSIQNITGKSSAADPCNLNTLYEMLYQHMDNLQMQVPKKDGNFNRLHALYLLEKLKNT